MGKGRRASLWNRGRPGPAPAGRRRQGGWLPAVGCGLLGGALLAVADVALGSGLTPAWKAWAEAGWAGAWVVVLIGRLRPSARPVLVFMMAGQWQGVAEPGAGLAEWVLLIVATVLGSMLAYAGGVPSLAAWIEPMRRRRQALAARAEGFRRATRSARSTGGQGVTLAGSGEAESVATPTGETRAEPQCGSPRTGPGLEDCTLPREGR